MSSQNNQLKETVLEKIKKGDVHMRPKIYYVLKIMTLLVVIACTILSSAFLVSYIFFSIEISDKPLLFGYGSRGILTFFELFPWFIFAGEIILILLMEWLLKRFKFAYHRPLIYLFLGGAVLSFFIGFFISITPLNQILLTRNEEKHLPLIGNFYENVERPSEKDDVFRGTITNIAGDIFIIQANDHDNDQDDGVRKVVVTPQMANSFNIGDKVFVAGDLVDNEIQAYGMSKIDTIDQG